MRYIDSGSRHESQALGTWLNAELNNGVTEIRIQSGFYSQEALAPFIPSFAALANQNALVRVVVGSNDGATLAAHLSELVVAMQLPREGADLGVVYYGGAYFHPKTYHLRRVGGSQAAYVGSANFTLSGIGAKHVEAGILLDTLLGDSADILNEIAAATDAWFEVDRPGFEVVTGVNDVQRLLAEGIIRDVPPPRPMRPNGQGGQPPQRPHLGPLVVYNQPAAQPVVELPQQDPGLAWQPLATVQKTPPYPPYVSFAPNTTVPTRGSDALTGTTLGNATGLVIKLSRDNDRHWRNAPGTANISIPVSTAASIRFGLYGERNRPRAEFGFLLRYVDNDVMLTAPADATGVMSFGFTPGDVGHADLRLVIPRAPVAILKQLLIEREADLPKAGDLALLEWPTPSAPSFKMTVIKPESDLGQTTLELWQEAEAHNQFASRGACWLSEGISPAW